jgi:hypothetical protein
MSVCDTREYISRAMLYLIFSCEGLEILNKSTYYILLCSLKGLSHEMDLAYVNMYGKFKA